VPPFLGAAAPEVPLPRPPLLGDAAPEVPLPVPGPSAAIPGAIEEAAASAAAAGGAADGDGAAEQSGGPRLSAEELQRIVANREQAAERRRARRESQSVVQAPTGESTGVVVVAPDAEVAVDGERAGDGLDLSWSTASEQNICLICQAGMSPTDTENPVQAMECMHVYHASCVREYMDVSGLQFRQACPLKCLRPSPSSVPTMFGQQEPVNQDDNGSAGDAGADAAMMVTSDVPSALGI